MKIDNSNSRRNQNARKAVAARGDRLHAALSIFIVASVLHEPRIKRRRTDRFGVNRSQANEAARESSLTQ